MCPPTENEPTSPTGTPHTGLLDQQIHKALNEREKGGSGGGRDHISAMSDRLAKLEGAFDGFKIIVALIVTIMIGGFAFIGTQQVGIQSRIYVLSEKIDSLPGKVSDNLSNLTKTLSEAITASKQTPPQVILMTPPAPPPTLEKKN